MDKMIPDGEDLWGKDQISERELNELAGEGVNQCPACGRLYHNGRRTCKRCGTHVLPPSSELELVKDDFAKLRC